MDDDGWIMDEKGSSALCTHANACIHCAGARVSQSHVEATYDITDAW